jgi:predicted DNA-binding transcriptional regulator YafY
MRASRLLSILTTLQARGLTTAEALAEECGVSLRTIYRDIDALSSAGIPVLSERGAEGGYRLLNGYRTQLNGLSEKEAEALFLTGLSGPAADLGLHAMLVAAEKKLMSALPAPLRAGAERMRARFHLDAPAWFREAERPKLLPLVASAVWEQHRIRMRYRSWKSEKPRVIDPLGLVLKGGAWYVVGQTEEGLRTYRVARILKLDVLEKRFERPEGFELEAYWTASTKRLESELHSNQATVRMSPRGAQHVGNIHIVVRSSGSTDRARCGLQRVVHRNSPSRFFARGMYAFTVLRRRAGSAGASGAAAQDGRSGCPDA